MVPNSVVITTDTKDPISTYSVILRSSGLFSPPNLNIDLVVNTLFLFVFPIGQTKGEILVGLMEVVCATFLFWAREIKGVEP
jgi:hypothetical protein